jgi:hypothetical protein
MEGGQKFMQEEDLLFNDFKELIKNRFITSGWLTVYLNEKEIKNIYQGLIYSALIAKDKVDDVLSKCEFDVHLGEGSDLFSYKEGDEEKISYRRFTVEGIEPLIYHRSFYGIKEEYLELSEEFRLYFNLYEEHKSNNEKKYIHIDENGDEEVIAIISENKVSVRVDYIKEYISVRNMFLAIYFDLTRLAEKTLEELSLKEINKTNKGKYYIFCQSTKNFNSLDSKSAGFITGKILIPPIKNYKPKSFEEEKYEKFIIGIDSNGNEKYLSCKRRRYYPVYFKREVLDKYYNNPDKFTVEDGLIKAKGLWSLRVDNNHPEYIIVFLGELGMLPYKEQLYWKSYNVVPSPNGGVSKSFYSRYVMGEFAPPDMPDHYFKEKYNDFSKKWYSKFGWDLFMPLSKNDEHHFKSLHRPSPENRKDFDEQVASIVKITVGSLNEKELEKDVEIAKPNPQGIDKLEAFLESKGYKLDDMIEFLRKLQRLRSKSVAHRKSEDDKELKKTYEYFHMDDKHLDKVFDGILVGAIKVFNTLERNLLAE